jgi:excinuclease UvrABC ATPase subunit
MRRIIFILMIALLPLRGWMGEAMATSMAANEITTNTIALKSINTTATSEFSSKNEMVECDMHKRQSHEVSDDESTANPSCTHCQACHATGLVNTVEINSITSTHLAQPLAFSSHFASANVALGQKPPIL